MLGNRKAWIAGIAAALLLTAGQATAAPVTLVFGGEITFASAGNPLGLTLASPVSGEVRFDDAGVAAVGLTRLVPDDAAFGGLDITIGSHSVNEVDDHLFATMSDTFPGLLFQDGIFVGFDFLQNDFACPGGVCDFGIGIASQFGAGGTSSAPNAFSFELDDSGQAFVEGVFFVEKAQPQVPEPGTMILLGSALVGLGVMRRRRRA